MTGVPAADAPATAPHPFPAVTAALRGPGYAFVPGPDVRAAVGAEPAEWGRFVAQWDELVLDPYVGEAAADRFRFRRYGRLALRSRAGNADGTVQLTPLPNRAFAQDARHVARYGGRPRRLEHLPAGFLEQELLHRLVAIDFAMLPSRPESCEVGLHAIRIVTTPAVDARPTPEGRHRDGHDFIAMHLIGKRGCQGGETLVYEQGSDSDQCIARMTLTEPLDTLVVDDSVVDHEVSRLEPIGSGGSRDVLLVAFYPLTSGDGEAR